MADLVTQIAAVLAESNGTPWDLQDPDVCVWHRDARAVVRLLESFGLLEENSNG
jgi:hypothetical protein